MPSSEFNASLIRWKERSRSSRNGVFHFYVLGPPPYTVIIHGAANFDFNEGDMCHQGTRFAGEQTSNTLEWRPLFTDV